MAPARLPLHFALAVVAALCALGGCGVRAQQTMEEMKAGSLADDYARGYVKKGSPGGMWFGPRLGKRGIPAPALPLQRLLLAAVPEQQAYVKSAERGTKRRFTPRLGRDSSEQSLAVTSKNVDFIPRLGRELAPSLLRLLLSSDGELPSYALYDRGATDDRIPALYESKSPPFSPRLGRQLELQPDIYDTALALEALRESGIRVARSTDQAKKSAGDCVQIKKSSKP